MSGPRYDWMDWLRGLMVLLMIQAHVFDSWLSPDARTSAYPAFVHLYLNAIPSRGFLFLLGLSVMLGLERARTLSSILGRGLALLAVAYVFRLQQLATRGFSDWDLGRVDILNCLAATMLLAGLLLGPLPARVRPWAAGALALLFFALGPVLGTTRLSTSLPQSITAYVGGERPMAWFPLFPWAGWGFLGAAAGRIWVRAAETPNGARRLFAAAAMAGPLLTAGGLVLERFSGWQYPSEIESDMGLARTALYAGLLALSCSLAGLASSYRGSASDLLNRIGRASLLIYWVHIELVYGLLSAPLHGRLSVAQAIAGVALVVAAMLGLVIVIPRIRRRRTRGTDPTPPASRPPLPSAGPA